MRKYKTIKQKQMLGLTSTYRQFGRCKTNEVIRYLKTKSTVEQSIQNIIYCPNIQWFVFDKHWHSYYYSVNPDLKLKV